jgi:adenylylsulfate kinase
MFHVVREWNRCHIPDYREIYLRVPIVELEHRDPKGLYAKVRRGEDVQVVGIDAPFEEPGDPDLVVDNFGPTTAAQTAARILALVTP